jgi:hypothetical protein
MDSVTVGWDDFEEMWNQGLGGERDGKVRQQATSNGFGCVRGQISKR